MKKALCLLVILFVLSCNRNQDSDLTLSDVSSTSKVKDANKISKQLFIYGAKSYSVVGNGVVKFDTYRDFSINNYVGNLNDYDFVLKDGLLKMNSNHEIGFKNNELIIITPKGTRVYNQNLDFSKLGFETKIMIAVYFELHMSDIFKNTFESYVSEVDRMKGCSWMDTYYVSGWGYTEEAAWSDYEYNMENSGISEKCKSIGKPRIKSMYISFGFTQIDFYQVDHPFCCN